MEQEAIHECRQCGWVGKESDKNSRQSESMKKIGVKGCTHVCPDCGHADFYVADTMPTQGEG
jgi:predicted RNA-binding Zn-ribbon protein involved in translation (DUF1610 family)